MHRVNRAHARWLVALCIGLRVSASIQYQSAPFTAARGWTNSNGILFNDIMAVLLILSYTSASFVILPLPYGNPVATNGFDVCSYYVCIPGLYLLLLGITLLLQVVIALSGMRAVKLLTWSSSRFDVTAALVQHAQLPLVPQVHTGHV
jgi:hypothetical protein